MTRARLALVVRVMGRHAAARNAGSPLGSPSAVPVTSAGTVRLNVFPHDRAIPRDRRSVPGRWVA